MKRSFSALIPTLLPFLIWGPLLLAQTFPQMPAGRARKHSRNATRTNDAPAPLPARTTPLPKAPEPNGTSIEKIVIKGNRKIETDAIKSKLVSKEGGPYDEDTIRQDIQELFNLGYFYDVAVDKSDGPKIVLTYNLTEKPSISEIEYKGNDEIEDTDLKEAAAIKPYEILNMGKIREATEKIEKLYEDKGYFLARISSRVEPTSNSDNVKLIFDIKENDKVRVKRISFIGNTKISSSKLKAGMITQEGGFFSFVSGAGAFKQDAFDRDVQMLNLLYFNEGYVQVKVDRPQVYVTPDKKAIYISIRVEEGEQFKVGTVDFTGDLLFSRSELFESTHIQEQGIFKYQVLQDDLKALQAKYGDLGYAYANPIPRTRIREADREVDITFEIDKGYKVYYGKFTMVGDSKTRDKVIRREMKIVEGELYNETRKRESLEAIKRLGFFEEVTFNTKTPKGRNDIMDIDVTVKERNTGTIQVGAGYSNYNGVVFNGQVNQTNFLGKGQKLGISIDISKFQSLFKASFTEPYFYDSLWSVGGDLYRSQRYLIDEYTETKTGAAARLGHPLAPYLDGFIRYKLEKTQIDLDPNYADPDLFPVNTANGITSSMTFTLEYDKRDDRFAPTKGIFASGSIEYAGLGGTLDYTKGTATVRYYHKIGWDVVWRNNLTYGFIAANDGRSSPPFNELFLLGGANSLRGFDWFTIGKRRFSSRIYSLGYPTLTPLQNYYDALRPFGGTQEVFYNLEFQFPLITEAGIKGVIFYDVGEADDQLELVNLRQDVGFGFRWFSPIGPLRFEWGFPLQRQAQFNENAVNFEFAIGAPF